MKGIKLPEGTGCQASALPQSGDSSPPGNFQNQCKYRALTGSFKAVLGLELSAHMPINLE